MDQANHTPRRRGAPLGNTNALKHGFYAAGRRQARPLRPLSDPGAPNLDGEIELLRNLLRRTISLGNGARSLDDLVCLLRAFSFASTSLTRLIQTNALFEGPDQPSEDPP